MQFPSTRFHRGFFSRESVAVPSGCIQHGRPTTTTSSSSNGSGSSSSGGGGSSNIVVVVFVLS